MTHLPTTMDEHSMKVLFAPFGFISRVSIGKSRKPPAETVASVEYKDGMSAAVAVQGMDKFELLGSHLRVFLDTQGNILLWVVIF